MRSRNDPRQLVIRALGLGFAGGLRSWPPLAALMLTYHRAPATAGWRRWPVLRNPWFETDLVPALRARVASLLATVAP